MGLLLFWKENSLDEWQLDISNFLHSAEGALRAGPTSRMETGELGRRQINSLGFHVGKEPNAKKKTPGTWE